MRVCVTGGAGYVGSDLVSALLYDGYDVVVYDLYIYGNPFEHRRTRRLTQIRGDIRNKEKLLKATKGVDAVIHLACISNDPSFNLAPELGGSINYGGFRNVVEAVKKNKVDRLIVASSTSQYGVKPTGMEVRETTKPEPITDYSRYKLKCERYLQTMDMGNTVYTFVRPATICGYTPRLRLDLAVNALTINALVNRVIKVFGGDQMRAAINIKDMVRFYKLMLKVSDEKVHNQAFNVAYMNATIKQYAEMVKKTLGDEYIKLKITPTDDLRSYHVNTDKIKSILRFKCRFTIKDAIRSLARAYERGKIKDGLDNAIYYNVEWMKTIGLR